MTQDVETFGSSGAPVAGMVSLVLSLVIVYMSVKQIYEDQAARSDSGTPLLTDEHPDVQRIQNASAGFCVVVAAVISGCWKGLCGCCQVCSSCLVALDKLTGGGSKPTRSTAQGNVIAPSAPPPSFIQTGNSPDPVSVQALTPAKQV